MKKRKLKGIFCEACRGSRLLQDVADELERATKLHKPLNSAHEGLAVIEEEFIELRREVFKRQEKHDKKAMREECIQIAAMALRFVRDLL